MNYQQGKIDYLFLPVPDWLKDMLKITHLTGRQSQAIWIIMDKTYGTVENILTGKRKEYAQIGEAYIAEVLKMSDSNATRTLTELSNRRIIVKGERGIKINSRVGMWLLGDLSKTITSAQTTLSKSICKVIENDKNYLPEMISIKERRNINKEASSTGDVRTPDKKQMAHRAMDEIKNVIRTGGLQKLKETYKDYKRK